MRFIHLADIHLGAAPDKGLPWCARREEEIWETFRRVIAGIREDPVDFLFIAGDLFHRQPLLGELKEVAYLFQTIPDTRVYLIAGNHDYMRKDSRYHTFEWPENVIFFYEEELTCVRDPELDVYVYGFSYHHQEIPENVLAGIVPEEGEGLHILLAHGGDEGHVPFNVKALASAGFDYIALGHIHKPQILLRDRAAFSGALEPIDRNDLGEHGYMEGHTEDGRLRVRFVPYACRAYEQILLELDENSTQGGIEDDLREQIKENGPDNIYRIVLTGNRPPELVLIPERLKALGNVTEIEDASRLLYDIEYLKKQYGNTLVGDYIRCFTDRECTPVEEKALYYGLQALLETSR